MCIRDRVLSDTPLFFAVNSYTPAALKALVQKSQGGKFCLLYTSDIALTQGDSGRKHIGRHLHMMVLLVVVLDAVHHSLSLIHI